MARRVLERELRAKHGIDWEPMGTPKSVTVTKEVHLHKTYRGVFSMQFNFAGDMLAVGYGSGGIQLFDSSGHPLKELRSCRQGGHSVMSLRFHPKQPNILYAATTEGTIFVYDCDKGEELALIEEPGNEINCMDFCVDGYNFATGGKDLSVRVYETNSNKQVTLFEGHDARRSASDRQLVNNTMRIFSLKFHPDNQYIFLTGGWDNHVKIWDFRANDGIKRNIRGPHICGDAIDLQDNTILTGQWTALHALQEYDYTSGSVVRELKYPHKDGAFLYSAHYCNKDLVVAGGSGTTSADFIQISTNSHVGGFKLGAPIHTIDSTKSGRIVAVGGATASFFILNLSD